MNDNKPDETPPARLSAAGHIALIVLVVFLVLAGWYGLHAWGQLQGVGISPLGWIFMAAGAVFTLALGAGLMALLFYSSRKNFDR